MRTSSADAESLFTAPSVTGTPAESASVTFVMPSAGRSVNQSRISRGGRREHRRRGGFTLALSCMRLQQRGIDERREDESERATEQ